MEQTSDVLDNSAGSSENICLSPNAITFLTETRKWVNFLSILGFIGVALMALMGLFAGSLFSFFASQMGSPVAGFPGFLGLVYVFMAIIYFFPILYLYKFAAKLKLALKNHDNSALESAFQNLKSHYKFVGIVAIIMIGFYVVGALFAVLAGAAAF